MNTIPSPIELRKPAERLLFIDFYRLVALFLMVQGHVFRALVGSQYTKSFIWKAHESVHKFTASLFLFGAGMIFMIVTRRRWDEYTQFGKRTWHRLRRYVYFLIIGIALRLPFFSLSKTIRMWDADVMAKLFSVDILHVIALGLILLHFICMLARKPRRVLWVVLPLAVAIMAFAPVIRSMQISGPVPLVSWISTQYKSQFVIIPWWGYMFLGAALGTLFPDSGIIKDERKLMNLMIVSGLLLLASAIAISVFMKWNFIYAQSYRPDQMLARVGVITSFMGFCWYLERWGLPKKIRKAFFLSEESLIVYVTHLLLVYGSVLGKGHAQLIGHQLGFGSLLKSFLEVASFTVLFTWSWHWLKKNKLRTLKILQAVGAALFLLAFLLNPY